MCVAVSNAQCAWQEMKQRIDLLDAEIGALRDEATEINTTTRPEGPAVPNASQTATGPEVVQ